MIRDDPAVVVTVPTEFEAHTIAAILKSDGIESIVTNSAPSWTGQMPISPTAGGSAVVVRRADLERAHRVLHESERDSVDLDWDQVDVGQREDNLPVTPVGHMPLPARIAAIVAAAILILSAVLAVILVIL